MNHYLYMGKYMIIYCDSGNSTKIMYDHYYSQLPEQIRKKIKRLTGHLTSFVGHYVWPKGLLYVPLTLTGRLTQDKNTQVLDFTIVKSASPYNIIFGRSAMKKFEAIASTIYGAVQFKTSNG